MRDFGSWFSERGGEKAAEVDTDATARLRCTGCGKTQTVEIKAYENGDTGWYVWEEVEADGDYEGRCGGSQFCLP
ncbi:hypothetical protein [Paraburkholderia sp. BCC1885]|uniref:hypothetical protein n=1 Tax=Paraburkholderia sp. BCC1885 TaxID=2562669 RepID=UPI001182E427|nr:hypothetical protein [Paraburkholderia sp. BCC1885]